MSFAAVSGPQQHKYGKLPVNKKAIEKRKMRVFFASGHYIVEITEQVKAKKTPASDH